MTASVGEENGESDWLALEEVLERRTVFRSAARWRSGFQNATLLQAGAGEVKKRKRSAGAPGSVRGKSSFGGSHK
jgi:hypothetical protein